MAATGRVCYDAPTLDFDFHLLGPQVLIETDTSRIGKSFRARTASTSLTLPSASLPWQFLLPWLALRCFYTVFSIFLPLAGHATVPGSWKPWSLFSVSSMGDTP